MRLRIVFEYVGGLSVTLYWLRLPVVWGLELICLAGLGLASAAPFIFIRDAGSSDESAGLLLFRIVPVIYSLDMAPQSIRALYQYNPVAALAAATHSIVIQA